MPEIDDSTLDQMLGLAGSDDSDNSGAGNDADTGDDEAVETIETNSDAGDDAGEGDGDGKDDEANAGDGEGDDDDEEGDERPRGKKSGSARLRERLRAAEARIAELSTKPVAVDKASIEARVKEELGDPPKEADYPDYLAFERAQIVYETQKGIVEREVKREAKAAEAQKTVALADKIEAFQDRSDAIAKTVADFSATITGAKELLNGLPAAVKLELLDSSKGPLISYHLAKNPKVAASFADMGPRELARAVGRLEAKLSDPKPRTKTNAEPPPKQVRGGAAVSNPKGDLDAWLKRKYGR